MNMHSVVGRWSKGIVLGCIGVLLTGMSLTGCRSIDTSREPAGESSTEATARPQKPAERDDVSPPSLDSLKQGEVLSLFDGQTLGQWKSTDFGGQGEVRVKDGAIHMEIGTYMTGVTWTGPVVRMDYEITLDAMRVEGNDFFCGLTFPVGEKPCTLVLGGWGGTVCGLSNIDYYDASENETTVIHGFSNGQWYHVRLRVVSDRIQAWLDGEEIVDVETTGRQIDIRPEVDLSQPLGVATWMTAGAIRNIEVTKLPPSDSDE